MIHTYRDANVLRSRSRGRSFLQILGFGAAVVLFFFGPFAIGWSPFTWTEAGKFGGLTAVALVVMYAAHRREHYGICGEIRLDDDGTCELETKRRVMPARTGDRRARAGGSFPA